MSFSLFTFLVTRSSSLFTFLVSRSASLQPLVSCTKVISSLLIDEYGLHRAAGTPRLQSVAKRFEVLEDLSGTGPAGFSDDIDGLLARAAERFAERKPAAVRQAAEMFAMAAGESPGRVGPLVAAVRARVWLADHESDPEVRRQEATVAVQLAQWCVSTGENESLRGELTGPERAACEYWLAAALGMGGSGPCARCRRCACGTAGGCPAKSSPGSGASPSPSRRERPPPAAVHTGSAVHLARPLS